jgi:sulfur carrier protein
VLIIVNGEQRDVADGMNGAELLELLHLPASTAVAELNGKVLVSSQFQAQTLCTGDVIELVTIVGGG